MKELDFKNLEIKRITREEFVESDGGLNLSDSFLPVISYSSEIGAHRISKHNGEAEIGHDDTFRYVLYPLDYFELSEKLIAKRKNDCHWNKQ